MRRGNWMRAVVLLAVGIGAGCVSERAETAASAAETAGSAGDWIGKTAKGFALPGIDGKVVDVGRVLGTKPVVLVFYRGVW